MERVGFFIILSHWIVLNCTCASFFGVIFWLTYCFICVHLMIKICQERKLNRERLRWGCETLRAVINFPTIPQCCITRNSLLNTHRWKCYGKFIREIFANSAFPPGCSDTTKATWFQHLWTMTEKNVTHHITLLSFSLLCREQSCSWCRKTLWRWLKVHMLSTCSLTCYLVMLKGLVYNLQCTFGMFKVLGVEAALIHWRDIVQPH